MSRWGRRTGGQEGRRDGTHEVDSVSAAATVAAAIAAAVAAELECESELDWPYLKREGSWVTHSRALVVVLRKSHHGKDRNSGKEEKRKLHFVCFVWIRLVLNVLRESERDR